EIHQELKNAKYIHEKGFLWVITNLVLVNKLICLKKYWIVYEKIALITGFTGQVGSQMADFC
ncbi:hypothetical protein OLP53_04085, partial [Campylobacter jejuni]|nr:hypothetical protein [Campylobacter jejuni]